MLDEAQSEQPLPVAEYAPTDDERSSMKAWKKRLSEHPPLPPLKVDQTSKALAIGPDHEDLGAGTALQMSALGAVYVGFYEHTLSAVTNLAATKGIVSSQKANSLLAMVAGVKPRDQVESMLAVQMAAIHDATLEMAARMKRVDTLPQHDSAERSLNKLARTFAAQMEALKRYRSKGEQRVIVERVTVENGGQAVVGLVEQGGRGSDISGR